MLLWYKIAFPLSSVSFLSFVEVSELFSNVKQTNTNRAKCSYSKEKYWSVTFLRGWKFHIHILFPEFPSRRVVPNPISSYRWLHRKRQVPLVGKASEDQGHTRGDTFQMEPRSEMVFYCTYFTRSFSGKFVLLGDCFQVLPLFLALILELTDQKW